jgi:hypothetical protein
MSLPNVGVGLLIPGIADEKHHDHGGSDDAGGDRKPGEERDHQRG